MILLNPICISYAKNEYADLNSYLPDGTEIKIRNDKAYYYCRGKFRLLPDEAYMLADGSLLTVKDGQIVEFVLIDSK